MDSFKRFTERILPDIDFFSSLKDCEISEKEYQRPCDVWKAVEMNSLGEYYYVMFWKSLLGFV